MASGDAQYTRRKTAVLTAGQRTSLGSLIASIFPDAVASSIDAANFNRDPVGSNNITCTIRESGRTATPSQLLDQQIAGEVDSVQGKVP